MGKNWMHSWAPAKVDWCCRNEGKSCPYDCGANSSDGEGGWSNATAAWCCAHVQRGCGATAKSSAPSRDDMMGAKWEKTVASRSFRAPVALAWIVRGSGVAAATFMLALLVASTALALAAMAVAGMRLKALV